jgi:hypothetical protein
VDFWEGCCEVEVGMWKFAAEKLEVVQVFSSPPPL